MKKNKEPLINELYYGYDSKISNDMAVAITKACVFYDDGTAKVIDFDEIDVDHKKEIIKKLRSQLDEEKCNEKEDTFSLMKLSSSKWKNKVKKVKSVQEEKEKQQAEADAFASFIPSLETKKAKKAKKAKEEDQATVEKVVEEDITENNTNTEEEVVILEGEDGSSMVLPSDEFQKIVESEMNPEPNNENPGEENEEEEKKGNGVNKLARAGIIAAGIGLGGIAVAAGMKGCGDEKDINSSKSYVTEISNEDNNIIAPSIEGKDFNFYKENALETTQKDVFANRIAPWLENTNGKEDWEVITLTDEEKEKYEVEGEQFVFGFTPEEALSLIMFHSDYSDKELYNITGGVEIDPAQMQETYNKTVADMIRYYILSPECNLGIENIVIFDESGVRAINDFEKMLADYKKVEFDENQQLGYDKMAEIEEALLEFAHNTEVDKDAKSLILRTYAPACAVISNLHQYKADQVLNVYNSETSKNETIKIKTDLFSESTNREFNLGFTNFDPEAYLSENGIDKEKYDLLISDIDKSISDMLYAADKDALNEFVEYSHNRNVEREAVRIAGTNVDPAKDLVGTYDYTTIEEMLSNYMKENGIYPASNAFDTSKAYSVFFNMFNKKIEEQQIAFKDTHGKTAGKPGQIIKDESSTVVSMDITDEKEIKEFAKDTAGFVDTQGNPTTIEKEKEKAVEVENKENGFVTEEEAIEDSVQEEISAQDAYDAGRKYGLGQASYQAKYAESIDPFVVSSWYVGVSDGEQAKAVEAQAGQTFGGEVTVNPEIKETVTKSAPAPEVKVDNKVQAPAPEVKAAPAAPVVEEPAKEETKPAASVAPVVEEPAKEEVKPSEPVVNNTTTDSNSFSSAAPSGFSSVAPSGFSSMVTDNNDIVSNIGSTDNLPSASQSINISALGDDVDVQSDDLGDLDVLTVEEFQAMMAMMNSDAVFNTSGDQQDDDFTKTK